MRTRVTGKRTGAAMILIALGAALTPACSSTTASNVGVGGIVTGEEGRMLSKDYLIEDKALAKEIQVLDIKARHVGDFLEGLVMVRNRSKETVGFEYRFDWNDEMGFPVESSIAHWTPGLLYGREARRIKALCPKPGATAFRVMIRRPNPIQE